MASIADFPHTADDASQALRDALAASGRTFIPRGVWVIDNVNLPNDAVLEGEGPDSIIRAKGGSTASPLNVLSAGGVTITSLRVQGNRGQTPDAGQPGINANDSLFLTVENCLVEDVHGPAIRFSNGTDEFFGAGTTFENNFLKDINGDGILVANSPNVRAVRNSIINAGGWGVHATDPESTDLSPSRALLVEGNRITNAVGGVYVEAKIDAATGRLDPSRPNSQAVRVLGNHVQGCREFGILSAGEDVTVSNNVLFDNGQFGSGTSFERQGIVCQAFFAMVTNNTVTRQGGAGIDMGGCRNFVVGGNLVHSVDGFGIEINACLSGNVVGNTITDACRSTRSDFVGLDTAGLILSLDQGSVLNKGPTQRVAVTGNLVGPGPNQKFGILADNRTGTSDVTDVTIVANVARGAGNTGRDIALQTTGVVQTHNIGTVG